MSCDRQLPGTDTVYRRRALSPSSCLFAFLVFAALALRRLPESATAFAESARS